VRTLKYTPVRICTLLPSKSLPFSLYIELNDRFVLYVRKGDNLTDERLKKLNENDIKNLFISGNDELKYQTYVDNNFQEIFD